MKLAKLWPCLLVVIFLASVCQGAVVMKVKNTQAMGGYPPSVTEHTMYMAPGVIVQKTEPATTQPDSLLIIKLDSCMTYIVFPQTKTYLLHDDSPVPPMTKDSIQKYISFDLASDSVTIPPPVFTVDSSDTTEMNINGYPCRLITLKASGQVVEFPGQNLEITYHIYLAKKAPGIDFYQLYAHYQLNQMDILLNNETPSLPVIIAKLFKTAIEIDDMLNALPIKTEVIVNIPGATTNLINYTNELYGIEEIAVIPDSLTTIPADYKAQ